MIVKMFRHGTGGSANVFNYLLGEDEKRLNAEVLRGDIETQKLLIDSLDFKRKYTSGCLSFEEAPTYLSNDQKMEIMDSFEKTIIAGLEDARVSFSWIEHRDKGRLELNFVIANVDLEHGRLFQPYIHTRDKTRINAWKDIQNITYGLSDPTDPLRRRNMSHRDHLPKVIKEIRREISDYLEDMVADGLISNRADVIQALQEADFEITRQTDKAISIKNPDPKGKHPIRLTGGLYERDFKFSGATKAEVKQQHSDYRAGATGRLEEAKQVLHDQLEAKRSYHQRRHGQPTAQQRAVADHVIGAKRTYRYSPYDLFRAAPSPFIRGFKPARKRHKDDDRELRASYRDLDTATRRQTHQSHQIRDENMGYLGFYSSADNINNRYFIGRINYQNSHQAHDHLQAVTSPSRSAISTTTADKVRIDHGQATVSASTERSTSPARHNSTPRADARQQRQDYSAINRIIDQIGRDAEKGIASLTGQIQGIKHYHEAVCSRANGLQSAAQRINDLTGEINQGASDTIRHTNAASRAYEQLSEYDSTAQRIEQRHERIRDDIRGAKNLAEYNQDYAGRNQQFAGYNGRETATINEGIERVRKIKQIVQERDQPEPKHTYSRPRIGW